MEPGQRWISRHQRPLHGRSGHPLHRARASICSCSPSLNWLRARSRRHRYLRPAGLLRLQQRTQGMGITPSGRPRHPQPRRLAGHATHSSARSRLGAAFALTRLIASFLFGSNPTTPCVVTVPVMSVLCGSLRYMAAATRASKLDPMESLRVE